MKMLRKSLFALAAVALLSGPALANSQLMCAPDVAVGPPGPKRVVNPITTNAYSLNNAGCALIAVNDVGYFASQGFTVWAPFGSVTVSGSSSPISFSLPAGGYIRDVIINETSGGTVFATGNSGIKIGTASTTSNVMSEIKITSNALVVANDISFGTRAFSTTGSTAMFLNGTFNSANINATIVYGFY